MGSWIPYEDWPLQTPARRGDEVGMEEATDFASRVTAYASQGNSIARLADCHLANPTEHRKLPWMI